MNVYIHICTYTYTYTTQGGVGIAPNASCAIEAGLLDGMCMIVHIVNIYIYIYLAFFARPFSVKSKLFIYI
jgi:hypothetical protein